MKIPMPTYDRMEIKAIQSELVNKVKTLRIKGATWDADRIDCESYSVSIYFDPVSSDEESMMDFYESSLLIMAPLLALEMDRRKTGWEGHSFVHYEDTVSYIDEDGISHDERTQYGSSYNVKSIFMMIYFEKEMSK